MMCPVPNYPEGYTGQDMCITPPPPTDVERLPLSTINGCREMLPTYWHKGLLTSSPVYLILIIWTRPVTAVKGQLTTWESPRDSLERQLAGGNRPHWGRHGLATHDSSPQRCFS